MSSARPATAAFVSLWGKADLSLVASVGGFSQALLCAPMSCLIVSHVVPIVEQLRLQVPNDMLLSVGGRSAGCG